LFNVLFIGVDEPRLFPIPAISEDFSMTFMKLHQTPDDPVIPEGIPIPGPRPNRSDRPPVSEPDRPLPPPTKEPPAPARRDQLTRIRRHAEY
jgi:hypothetical protein